MNYLYTPNFFYKTDLNIKSIEFINSNKNDVYLDFNSRNLVVEFIPGLKYNELTERGFANLSDELITEEIYLTRNNKTIVNGIQYYGSNEIEFIEVLLIDDDWESEYNYSYITNSTIFYVIKLSTAKNWTPNNYVEFINSSGLIISEVVDESKFKLCNISGLNIKYGCNRELTSQYPYKYIQIGISEKDIISQCIQYLKKTNPKYIFSAGLTELTGQEEKSNLIFYNAKLTENGEFSTRIMRDEEYGHLVQTSLVIEFEYLSDDLESYLRFREMMFLGNEFLLQTSFKLIDSRGDGWSYSLDWNYDFSNELERTPITRYLDETSLYSMKFSCKVVGWLVEKLTTAKTIKYPIYRIYESNKLVAALFDKTDPNVYTKAATNIGDGFYLLIDYDKNVKIINTYILGDDGKLHKIEFESPNEYTLYINLDTPIDPVQLDPGYYISSGLTIFENKNTGLVSSKDGYKLKIDITAINSWIANNQSILRKIENAN